MLPFTCLHEYKRIVDAGFVQHCKYQAYICKKAVEFCCRSSQEGRGFECSDGSTKREVTSRSSQEGRGFEYLSGLTLPQFVTSFLTRGTWV